MAWRGGILSTSRAAHQAKAGGVKKKACKSVSVFCCEGGESIGAPHGPPRSFFRFGFLFAVKTGFFFGAIQRVSQRRMAKFSIRRIAIFISPKNMKNAVFFGKNPRFAYRETRNGAERN